MFKRLVLFGAVGVMALQLAGLATASAAPTKEDLGGAKANIIGNVKIDATNPQVGYVTANYTCPAGSEAHLWVSAKQVATAAPDNGLQKEGSSGISAAWLQRHPGANEFTCDGAWHTGTFSIDAGLSEYGFG